MRWPWLTAVILATTVGVTAPRSAVADASLLSAPVDVEVRGRFEFHDVLEIHDETESFEFIGVLTLVWKDPRQAFDPEVVGASEKVYTGSYQFNEVATGWYPEAVLVNASGGYDTLGVVLHIAPDGTATLTQAITGVAEAEFNMALYPFDTQRLEMHFTVLGEEVSLAVHDGAESTDRSGFTIPQWDVTGSHVEVRDRVTPFADRNLVTPMFVASVDVERKPLHVRRLVIFPLTVIVLLSFSVFWMDRESLGDRVNVSFIGILTGVTYQLVIGDSMPQISYGTLIHGFLMLCFLTMCSTVVINLVVGALDSAGKQAVGDRVDHHCRWAFPVGYVGLVGALTLITFARA